MSMIYYHNPRCSKSRQGLAILEKKKLNFTIKEYLKEPMTKNEVESLFNKIDIEPLGLIRTKESIFKELELKKKILTQAQWAQLIVKNPILLERPILVNGNKAIVGRPPEELNKII